MTWDLSNSLNSRDSVADEYEHLPVYDPRAVHAWRALAEESKRHADMIRGKMNVHVVDDPEPYATADDMIRDIKHNNNFLVSRANSDHPIWTPDDNVNFRIVHDVLGHAATGGRFTWKGENDACATHHSFSSPLARQALTTECLGQVGWASKNGGFGIQRVGVMPNLHSTIVRDNHRTHTISADYVLSHVLAPGRYIDTPNVDKRPTANPNRDVVRL